VYALVLVGDVEEAPVAGDRDALDTRQAGKLANEGCFEGAGVGVRWERAAEVGRHRVPAAGVVLYQDALPIPAVDVAGHEVQLFAVRCGDDGEVAHPGYVAGSAHGIHDPEAPNLRQPVAGLEEALDTL